MAVTITGTLEMIYTVGADTISEPLYVDMPSPTEEPLRLDTGLVFTDPAVDVRDTLEPYLTATYGFTSITRVGTPRAGALAEWTAVLGGITRAVVLWGSLPLRQVGVEWGQTATGNVESARGYEATVSGARAEASGDRATALGTDAKASGRQATALGSNSRASGMAALASGYNAKASSLYAQAHGINALADQVATTEFAAPTFRVVLRDSDHVIAAVATRFQLADATGTLHTIGANASNGLTYDGTAMAKAAHTHAIADTTGLQTALDGKASATHNHDDRYYTEVEVNDLLPKPPARGVQNQSTTRTTAGDIDFTASATVGGLTPGASYIADASLYLWMLTSGTGSFRPIIKIPTASTEMVGSVTAAFGTTHDHSWGNFTTVTADASGNITVTAAARWVAGTITSSRAEIILRVTKA